MKNHYLYLKLFITFLAAAYFIYYLKTPQAWHFIDNVNLLIHEAGHWIFWPFGDFLHVLGGSLNQCLIPALFVLYFYIQGQSYSAALTLFWVAQNFINVSIYAGDAVKMQLPLLGGDGVIHDWNWLLIYTGQLHHAAGIALAIKALGVGLAIIATIWAIVSALNEGEKKNYG